MGTPLRARLRLGSQAFRSNLMLPPVSSAISAARLTRLGSPQPFHSKQMRRGVPRLLSRAASEAFSMKGSWGSGDPPKKQTQDTRGLEATMPANLSTVVGSTPPKALWEGFWQKRQSKLQPYMKTARLA